MRVSIHQPAYLQWCGLLEKIKNCDLFVFLDTVQFSKNSFDNRNRIPNPSGSSQWLTIPIKHSGRFGQKLIDCEPDNYNWVRSHPDIIKKTYLKENNFLRYFDKLLEAYGRVATKKNLADIDWEMLWFFLNAFNINTPIIRSSDHNFKGKGSDLVKNICVKLGASEYYSGRMGRDYLVENDFTKNGIKVIYQEYEPPTPWSAIHQLFINGPSL